MKKCENSSIAMLWQKILLLSKNCIYMNTIKECMFMSWWMSLSNTPDGRSRHCGASQEQSWWQPSQSERMWSPVIKRSLLSCKHCLSFYLAKQVNKKLSRTIRSERFFINWSHITSNKKARESFSNRFYRDINQGEEECSNDLPHETTNNLKEANRWCP